MSKLFGSDCASVTSILTSSASKEWFAFSFVTKVNISSASRLGFTIASLMIEQFFQ